MRKLVKFGSISVAILAILTVLLHPDHLFALGSPSFEETLFFNAGTNVIWVDELQYDGKDSGVPCGWLGPKVGASADMPVHKVPAVFKIIWHTPGTNSGSQAARKSQELDSAPLISWLHEVKPKDAEIVFVFTKEQQFKLKLYVDRGESLHYDGTLLPDEKDPRFLEYKELVRSSISGDAKKVSALLEKGAPFSWPEDPKSLSPLEWSVRWGKREAFDVLRQRIPADYSPFAYAHCIQLAVGSSRTDFLSDLFKSPFAKAVPDSCLQEIFYLSAYQSKSPAVIEMLLKQFPVGINFKVRDVGHTMLFVAVQDNDLSLAKWLLDHGASQEITLSIGTRLKDQARSQAMKSLLQDYAQR